MKIKSIISVLLTVLITASAMSLSSCSIFGDKEESSGTESSAATSGESSNITSEVASDASSEEISEVASDASSEEISEEASETTTESVKQLMERKELIKYVKERTVTVSTDTGTGTGFFIDNNGTLITNYHVIEGASQIEIIMENNATFSVGTIVDFSEIYDLAVLKAEIKDTPYLELFDGELEDGESVCAVGSPVGYQGISTEGMISKTSEKKGMIDCIVSTATINHGNSGGPLVNFYGEVIGVNAFGDSRDTNLFFAINISELDNLTMDKNWSVSRFTDWYVKEVNRSYKIYVTSESTDESSLFALSTLHTYQEVTGARCIASGNTVNTLNSSKYDERCQYHRYEYSYQEFNDYTEYIFSRGFEYVDSYTELNLVIYVYVNYFDGTQIIVYVEDNKNIILQVCQ